MRGSRERERGGGGHKNIEFLNKTGPDSLKMTKLPSQHSMSAFRWRADDGPLIWILTPPHQLKKSCQSWNPSDKTFWFWFSTVNLYWGRATQNTHTYLRPY